MQVCILVFFLGSLYALSQSANNRPNIGHLVIYLLWYGDASMD